MGSSQQRSRPFRWKSLAVAILLAVGIVAADAWTRRQMGVSAGIAYLAVLPLWYATHRNGIWAGLATSLVIAAGLSRAGSGLWPIDGTLFSLHVTCLTLVSIVFAVFDQAWRTADRLARLDGLTGLPNRHSGQETARQIVAESRHRGIDVAVILLDCDGFKQINDRFGHGTGDEALRTIGKSLASSVRQSDVVCRLGGDEFLMVLVGADPAAAGAALKRLQERIRKNHADRRYELRLSHGMAHLGPDGQSLAQLLEKADRRMYLQKRKIRLPGQNADLLISSAS